MKNMNLKSVFGLVFATTLLFLGACKKTDTALEGSASLRIVNAFQGSSAQDFYQDDNKLASAVVYGNADSKTSAKTGSHALKFTNTSSTTANSTTTVSLNLNSSFIVFYNKKADGTGEILGYESNSSAVPAGKSYVRFINLASLLNNTIDIDAGVNASLATALVLKGVTNYTAIDAGTNLNFKITGSLVSNQISGSEFKTGKIYTVWFDSSTATTANYHVVTEN